MLIRNRIVGYREVPANQIRPNPKNWALHSEDQRNAIKGIFAEVGVADAVKVREVGDGTYMLIDGHLRTEEIGQHINVPVLVLDVSEEEADKLLLTVNRIGQMVGTDQDKLNALMEQVALDSVALNDMLAAQAAESGLVSGGGDGSGSGEPQGGGDPPEPTWGVLVNCASEAEQVRVITLLQREGVTNFRTLVG